MSAFLAVLLTLVAVSATVTVLIREPVRQAIVLGIMGLFLALLFFTLQAPDVALSELTVGSLVIPVMLTLTIAKLRALDARGDEAQEDEDEESRG
ncbi:MAG TPA: hydrogenase subunit MbhD domain-containing protein [Solirubrobacteraceae bacterium]|nr:hydrogenase subunit MbhD domain-containing protein [Solirubrobacteraceae bacterium]